MSTPALAAGCVEKLLQWSWPGNVRELENVIQRAVVLMQGDEISASDLVFGAGPNASHAAGGAGDRKHAQWTSDTDQMLRDRPLADIEREAILATLESTGGNKTEAARRMGVSARTLSNKMKLWRAAGLVA
jgi:two-component system response regulator HydG